MKHYQEPNNFIGFMYCSNAYQPYFTGETDLHFSKEGVYPSWYGYAVREKAPFKEHIDKW